MFNMSIKFGRKSDRILRAFPLVSSKYRALWWGLGHKWLSANGPDWTLDRMKELSLYLIHVRSGEEAHRPSWWRKSLLRYPEAVALNGQPDQFLQLIQVIRSWTLFLGKERLLRRSDIQKFHDAVERTDSTLEGVNILKDILVGRYRYDDICPTKKTGNCRRRRPYISAVSVIPEFTLSKFCRPKQPITFRSEEMHRALEAMEYSEMNGWLMPDWMVRYRLDPDESHGTQWPFGYVDYRIQSDGKVRWFYAAPPWQNEMFSSYSRELYKALRAIKEDCTFNQNKGVTVVQRWLAEGRRVHSIDLSSATDSFPFELSKIALLSIANSESRPTWSTFIRLYESLVIKPGAMIRTPMAGEQTHVTWTKGQPLGAQASFAMFALSHHFLVRLAFWRVYLKWNSYDDCYVLLGDDIVISDDKVAKMYRRMCTGLGIPISEHKSVSSPRVAEFGGRLILPQASEFKFKAFEIVPENLHSAISILGSRAVKACRASFARNVMALIPQEGYHGTNPGGFPHDQVVKFYTWLQCRVREDQSDLSEDMYATRKQVHARHALNIWAKDWDPSEVSKDLPVPHFHSDPVTGVVWKWKPFLRRSTYSEILRVARTIFRES